MTLHELCDVCGVSRRAVQGYEKAGLVHPSGRNPRGYLIYDPAAQERIRTVRMYQRFGFQIKEIKLLLSLPPTEQKEKLIRQKEILAQRQEELNETITLLTELIRSIP